MAELSRAGLVKYSAEHAAIWLPYHLSDECLGGNARKHVQSLADSLPIWFPWRGEILASVAAVTGLCPPTTAVTDADVVTCFGAFCEVAQHRGLSVPNLTPARRAALLRALGLVGREGWSKALATITGDTFYSGDNDRGWRLDFDWLTKDDGANALRLMELAEAE